MKTIRQRLGWKIFLSYLIIIVVGVVSLAGAAELHAPAALTRHMAHMQASMGSPMGGMMADLTASFRQAVNEVLAVAAAAALVSAVVVSIFVTRRIVRPIQAMQVASRRIAKGRYDERVQVVGEDELSDLARSFNQMVQQLAQTEDRRRQLIGDVAHELRTPLSSIKSVLEGLQDGVLPAEPATFFDLQREVSRLQRLVSDLEESSKAEAGQIPLELKATDPATLVQTAVDRLARQFEDKGVQLHTKLPPDLPPIQVDPIRMTQVMLNLLGNALQYTQAGGQVTVHTWAGTHEVHIAIQDTGIGLTTEQLSHVFERFYRVDKSRSRAGGGSGIGLTIARHLVEAHHGHLTATSPGPDQGSTFTVTLPICA
jgi:signal transduction histidine kinase